MDKDITGKNELDYLKLEWADISPGKEVAFTTFCCASGTCGDYLTEMSPNYKIRTSSEKLISSTEIEELILILGHPINKN